MAITDYPAGLPLAQRDGYAFKSVNNINRTDMQSGRPRQRIEFENVPDMLQLKWNLTSAQASLFAIWARSIVGAGWFKMRIVTPLGFDDVEMRFTARIDGPELVGRYAWVYTGQCEIRNMPQLEDDWILLPDYILYSDIFDYAMNREWPLQISYALTTQDGFILTTEDGFGLTTE